MRRVMFTAVALAVVGGLVGCGGTPEKAAPPTNLSQPTPPKPGAAGGGGGGGAQTPKPNMPNGTAN